MYVLPTLNPLSKDDMEDSPLGLKDSSHNLCVDPGVSSCACTPQAISQQAVVSSREALCLFPQTLSALMFILPAILLFNILTHPAESSFILL